MNIDKIKKFLADIPRQQFLIYNKRDLINVIINCYEQIKEFANIMTEFINNVESGVYRGIDGIDGVNGINGKDGRNGRDGKDGKDGINGKDGKDGIDGAPGKDGEKGDKGEQGPQGIQGERGPKGDKGDKGDIGPRGPKGERGLTGPQGERGLDGEPGSKGEPGDSYIITEQDYDNIADLVKNKVKNIFWAEFGVTTFDEIIEAHNKGYLCCCKRDTKIYIVCNYNNSNYIYFNSTDDARIFYIKISNSNKWTFFTRYLEDSGNRVNTVSDYMFTYPSCKAVYDFGNDIKRELCSYLDNAYLDTVQDYIFKQIDDRIKPITDKLAKYELILNQLENATLIGVGSSNSNFTTVKGETIITKNGKTFITK